MKILKFILIMVFSCFGMAYILIGQDYNYNFEGVIASYKKYNFENQLRFKEIFIRKYLEETKEKNQLASINIDSISMKIIPRYKVKVKELEGRTIKELDIDTTITPERCFAFYKGKLLGYIKFSTSDIYLLLHHKKSRFYDLYECLSRQVCMIYICGIRAICTINNDNIIDSFDECIGRNIESNQSLIERIFEIEINDINKCEFEIELGPFDFY